jgi:hypothetical protein
VYDLDLRNDKDPRTTPLLKMKLKDSIQMINFVKEVEVWNYGDKSQPAYSHHKILMHEKEKAPEFFKRKVQFDQ